MKLHFLAIEVEGEIYISLFIQSVASFNKLVYLSNIRRVDKNNIFLYFFAQKDVFFRYPLDSMTWAGMVENTQKTRYLSPKKAVLLCNTTNK